MSTIRSAGSPARWGCVKLEGALAFVASSTCEIDWYLDPSNPMQTWFGPRYLHTIQASALRSILVYNLRVRHPGRRVFRRRVILRLLSTELKSMEFPRCSFPIFEILLPYQ